MIDMVGKLWGFRHTLRDDRFLITAIILNSGPASYEEQNKIYG